MSSSAELTLGRPCHGVVSHGAFGGGHNERFLKLEYYLKALEDERKKIEAFKRELPFCMQLLNDEIEASKEQLADYQEPAAKAQSTLTSICEENPSVKSTSVRPVFEEFMPIKKSAEDVQEDTNVTTSSAYLNGAKPNGVIQTKFWTPAEAYAHGQEIVSSMTDKPYKKRDNMRMGGEEVEVAKPILNPQKRGGAFVPFCGSKKHASTEHLVEALPHFPDREVSPIPCADMARSSTGGVHHHHDVKETQNVTVAATTSYTNGVGQTTQRKPRRCWSPELHRRFVNALQQLGGSEVATPKQIRELMKVDGLTNDEVKSHLQKYRLHTRRPTPSFHAASTPQVVVLGGIWVPPEYAAHAAASVSQAVPQQQEVAERQATHVQATPSYTEDRYIQLNSAATTSLQLHPSLYGFNGEERPAATAAQSQGSSQGPLHHLSTAHSSDGREEESEEGNEGCSWKDEDRSMHDQNGESLYDTARAPLHVHKWMYNNTHESGEDDSEAEDGRVYETPI